MVFEVGRAVEAWEMELSIKTEKTRFNYRLYLRRFLERWGVTPDGLYEMRLSDLKSDDPRDRKRVENMIKVQMSEMKRAGAAASTCRNVWKAVRCFFEAQGLDLKLKAKDKPQGQYNGQKLVLADQIREMHDACGWEFKKRNRALLLFLKDSGLRVSDVAALNIEDYEGTVTKYNDAGEAFKVFEPINTRKTGSLAYVVIGPESVNALEEYLSERRAKEEIEPDAPIFVNRSGKRFKQQALSAVFFRLRDKLGLEGRSVSAHSLRKFHTTMLEAAMPRTWIAKLQGKTVRDSMGVYSQPELLPGELTQAYMKAYNRIRVFGAVAVKREDLEARDEEIMSQSHRVQELEEEVERLRVELGAEKSNKSGYMERTKKLEEDVAELKKMLKLIYDSTLKKNG